MAKTFYVSLAKQIDNSYPIDIGHNLIEKLCLETATLIPANKYAIITDENLENLYAKTILKNLQNKSRNITLITVPAGENSKTREFKAFIEDKMIAEEFGRDSAIVAVGGGMISDLAGFVAGTFCRGIPFIIYSTSILSAADASIGGKTAINTSVATNLIGVFHQPKKVYIDLDTWHSLPIKEIRSGLAETIKHACLADKNFFAYLEKNINKIVSNEKKILNKEVCEFIAYQNCKIKHKIVSLDEKEKNLRQILNLGHTAGRALEALLNYQYPHGECVAIGIVLQLYLAQELDFVSKEEACQIISLLKKANLPVNIPKGISIEQLVKKMKTDKKVRKGKIRFVFQKGIGEMKTFNEGSYSIELDENFIINTLKKYCS